jgi:membrane-associated phospholipid phosphatase
MADVAAPPRRSVPNLLLQLGGLAVLLALAELLPRLTTFHDLPTGIANAEAILELERTLGIDNERRLAAFAADHRSVVQVGDALYVGLHVPVMAGVLLWVHLRRPDRFPWLRALFVVAMLLTVAGYVALPTAPPRFLPGFPDPGAEPPDAEGAVNTLAAFPSGHVVFAAVASMAPLCILRSRPARAAWALYPPFVAVLVVLTGHHFWLDVIAAAAVAVAARVVADRVSPPAPRR